ncbi:cobyric acid synthase [Methylibium sp.]|uniref:cobyric acid synthase n=1 Tax=Methylibium sp. TaxID=2067992 RepID=UPI003D1025C6
MTEPTRPTARAVMVLGTTSGAGKSWLATALCRWYARQGLKVAPFKAQNMSNNARVVPGPGGRLGEIGSAQYFQALAAKALPDVRMNPVLLKPENDTASQVVVLGEVSPDLAAVPWRERSERLWPLAQDALQSLMAENDVVVIEGAGSPAEINLHASDYVNMRTAQAANAACLLVSDIDRGGAFAHLYGTHQLLQPAERALLRGFVLNRFRGDVRLLEPGPAQLMAMTGVPTLAVLPMWRGHGLPEEDGLHDEGAWQRSDGDAAASLRIAVVAYPRLSNLDEFQPLRRLRGVQLRWARSAAELSGSDWIVLPGSKHTSGDLAWLREQGMDAVLSRHAAASRPVLGLCGGLQMLGEALVDPHGVEGENGEGNAPGLGLLPLVTAFEPDKLLRHTDARFDTVAHEWSMLSGVRFAGYEIRHGRSVQHPALPPAAVALRNAEGEPIGWQRGSVLGLYAHGLFESTEVLRALFGARVRSLEAVFDGLADFIDRHFEPGALMQLLADAPPDTGKKD